MVVVDAAVMPAYEMADAPMSLVSDFVAAVNAEARAGQQESINTRRQPRL